MRCPATIVWLTAQQPPTAREDKGDQEDEKKTRDQEPQQPQQDHRHHHMPTGEGDNAKQEDHPCPTTRGGGGGGGRQGQARRPAAWQARGGYHARGGGCSSPVTCMANILTVNYP